MTWRAISARPYRLVKLLRVFKIMRLFERYQDDLFRYMHLLSVGKLIIIMLAGTVACCHPRHGHAFWTLDS